MTFSKKVSIITYYEYKKEKLGTLSVHCEQTQAVALTRTCPRGDDIKSGIEKFSTLSAYTQGGGADKDCLYSISSGCGGGGLGKALEGGEESFEGIERLFKINPSIGFSLKDESNHWMQKTFVFKGRTPAAQPDCGEVLKALRGFIEPYRQVINPLLVGLTGNRDEENCAYSSLSLYWTVITGFFLRLRSRNQMDMTRNTKAYSASIFELSGQPYNPDDPKLHTACSQTCTNLLHDVETEALEKVLVELVRYMIRSKLFDNARLFGCLCVAIDGTLCERKRSSVLDAIEKRRYCLEARIITPWGWNIPLLTESVEPYNSEREKQDCELEAFKRLSKRLKRYFPNQGFCILGDALYACKSVMDICRDYKWEYILTFKEGSMPRIYENINSAMHRTLQYGLLKQDSGEREVDSYGLLTWVDGRETVYEDGEGVNFRVVRMSCWGVGEDSYNGEFCTSFEVSSFERAKQVMNYGRRRWNIENGFKVEKYGGFGLEHTFCNDDKAGKNYHVLMQIAYALWQVFEQGMLVRLSEKCRKITAEGWAKLLFVGFLMIGLRYFPVAEIGVMRMRRYHLVA